MHLSVKPPSKQGFPIRAVEDHHVDRTGVEEWQHLKLTVTNCSIGLNSLHVVWFTIDMNITRSGKLVAVGL